MRSNPLVPRAQHQSTLEQRTAREVASGGAMARVERIEEVTANRVRAGAVVSTMSQAVQELLSNSVDAGATCVEIKIDLPSYRLSVADNGGGIPAEKLQSLVATARATSKARSAEDMQRACTYGFRGEALYSLGLTSLVEIQSRCAGKESHAKVVREGQALHFGPARAPLRTGTIVTLRDAFFKWPVRRKASNEVTEMLRIKEQVSRVALVNNSVAITVIDSAKSKQVVRAAATGSITRSFAQLFSSDKLSTARKLTFDFKQFRITGYLSPPSSTACHWSKEFQFVYVNRRCVRRLDFLQKAINNAFAPCMTLLAGRGGADGQGVIRRVRDPNASSGQRQELFPVFVMNLECPPDEVDITSEPDKTWVEFSNWPAARNACVAMLLAFLSHFPHAVPSTVLRDLRRTFQRNEGGETWTIASPPRPTRGAGRASPEPAPSPSPSPMRLTAPDLGTFSDVAMGAVDSCAWMGKDPGSDMMGEEGGEAMEFQGGGIRGGGVLYPSPASRFGARDSDFSRLTAVPFGALDDDDGVAIDVSPHFARHRERRRSPHGRERRRSPDSDRWETSHSPFFDKFDGQGRYSGRESPQPRQFGLQGIGAGNSYRRRGDRVCSDFEPPVTASSDMCPSVLEFEERAWEGENDAESENRARGHQVQDARGYRESVGGGWAANVSNVRSRTTPSPDPLPPSTSADFGVIGDQQNEHREAGSTQQRAGRRLHGSDSDNPGPLIVSRNSQKGRRVGNLPAVAEETHSSKRCKGNMYTAEGGNARSLSRLFDYAFTDKGRRQGLSRTTGVGDSSRNDGGHLDGGHFRGAGGGGSLRSTLPIEVEYAFTEGQDARRPRSSPPPPSRDALGAGKDKQALVGVTVRRPQSPQFGFMAENGQPDAPQGSLSWQQGSHKTRLNDEEGSKCITAKGPKCVTDGDSKVDDVRPQAAQSPSSDKTRGYSERPATRSARMLVGGTTSSRSAEHSPLAGWAGEIPSPEAGTACTSPRANKRRRPESWATANASLARNLSPFPLATGHFANIGRKSDTEESSRPQSRPIDLASSPEIENRLSLEGGDTYAGGDGDTVGAPRIPHTGDAAWTQGRGASCDRNGESSMVGHADGVGKNLTPPAENERSAADGLAMTQPMEAEMMGENLHVKSAREPDASGWVEEDSQRRVAGLQIDSGMFGETPCLDTACEGDATGWVGESSQRLPVLQRLDQQPVGRDETALDVGATPGTPSPRAVTEIGTNHNGSRDRCTGDDSGVKDCQSSAVSARAADYDRDVLGGDGLPDTSCHMPDAGVAAVRYPQGSGRNRERDGVGEAEQALGQRTPVLAAEKPISEVLQAGRDEVGAGAGAVAVTVTPEELAQACVIGQAGRKFVLLRARTGALLCVDQHAADERIKLEELQRQVFGEKKNRRNIERLELDPPETLSVTSSDRELLEQHRKVLFSWHFDVEVTGGQESHGSAPGAILRTVPVLCGVRMSVQDLMGFLRYLRETVEPGSSANWVRPPQVQHILNYKACHSAIRFGDLLSRTECVDLIKKLAACARPFCCAHGRPSVVPLCVLGGGASVADRGRGHARRRGGGSCGAVRHSRGSTKRADAVG